MGLDVGVDVEPTTGGFDWIGLEEDPPLVPDPVDVPPSGGGACVGSLDGATEGTVGG